MASLGSSIRSAARATYSAYRTIPFRWRLAGGSAGLTFIILASFAVIVGVLTNRQVRTQFAAQQGQNVELLYQDLNDKLVYTRNGLDCNRTKVDLGDIASVERAEIRIFNNLNGNLLCTQKALRSRRTPLAPPNFSVAPDRMNGYFDQSGFRVAVRQLQLRRNEGRVTLLYALPLSDVNQTIAKVRAFLLLGVLGGTVLALLAGLFVSARASRPIVELTDAAREIERTRDASKQLPHPEAQDEIAELARTLGGMLSSLDSARSEVIDVLDRQREFVADASHELRTPLTSVLANLELLTEELAGEQAETAEAALRSTRRMRRLVGDLLLLARADAARRVQPHRPTDLADVLVEATAELGPMAEHHEVVLEAEPIIVDGVRDELHRLVLNLLENAVRHTPPGTRVRASTRRAGDEAEIVVSDDGPGVPPELADRVFERFVRGGRDGGRGSGLGLAIVRSVAESHGGQVALQTPPGGHGTRFVITLPLDARQPAQANPPAGAGAGAAVGAQTSTTTGRTIGRRRSRS